MWEECRRILECRMIWLLLAGAMTVNIWMIWNFGEQADYAAVSGELAKRGVKTVTRETQEEIIGAFAAVEERYPGEIRVQNLVEGAVYLARHATAQELAENLADACVTSMKLEGDAAEYVRKTFGTLESIIEQNQENGTAEQFFVPCGGRFFDLFSRWLPLALTIEAALTSVLLMMKCVNEPFDRHTCAVIYATRTGREINRVKRRCVLTVTAGFTAAVWSMTMVTAGAVFPIGELWDTKLGSMMVLDSFYPLVTRFPVSIRTHMAFQFLLSLCLACVYGEFAYAGIVRTHRAFSAFGKMAFVCFGAAVLTQISPRDTMLYFILRFQPVDFAAKAGRWFASGGKFFSVKGYELLFVIFWGGAAVCFGCLRSRRFLREDL